MDSIALQREILLKRLQELPFLHGVDGGSLEEVAASAAWRVFPAAAVIFWEGDTESHLFYLQYGWLKVIKTGPDGREQILRVLEPGEVFNEIGVFARRPNPATAVVLEEAGIWFIPRSALEGVLMRHPQAALRIVENMADRFIDLVALTADLSLRTVEARLAKLLLDQAEGDAIARRRWTTQVEMAARLGTVPDVLSRVLREFGRAGLIEMSRESIRILNRAGLEERTGIPPEGLNGGKKPTKVG